MSSTEDTVLVALGPDADVYRLPKTLIEPFMKALVERDGWCTNAVTNRPEKTVVLCYVPQLLDFHGSDTPVVDLCLQVDEYPVYAWGGVSKLIAASIAAEREFTGLEKATVSLKSASSCDTLAPPKTLCSSCQHKIDCGAKGMQDPFEDQAGYEADTKSHETMIPAFKNKTEIAEMAQTLLDLDDFKLHLASLTSRIEGLLPAWISVKLADIERGATFVEKGADALDLSVTRAYVDQDTDAVDLEPFMVLTPYQVLEPIDAAEHEADSSALIGASASYWDLREDARLFNDEDSAEKSYWNLNDPVVLPPMDEPVIEEAVVSEPKVDTSLIPLAVKPTDAPIEAHITLSPAPLVEVNPVEEEAVISEPTTLLPTIPLPSIANSPSPIPPTAEPDPIEQEQKPHTTLSPALSFECGLSDCRTRHGPALMALKARQEAEMRAYAVVWEKEADKEREEEIREDGFRASAGADGDTLVNSVPAVEAVKKVLPPPSSFGFECASRANQGGEGWPGIHAVLAAAVVESPVDVGVEVDCEMHPREEQDDDGRPVVDWDGEEAAVEDYDDDEEEEEEEEEEASYDVDGGCEEEPEDELGVVAEEDDERGWETDEHEEVVDDNDDGGEEEEEEKEEDASYDGDDESAELETGLDEDEDENNGELEMELEWLESDVEDASYEGDDESEEDCDMIFEEEGVPDEMFDGESNHYNDEDYQEQEALGVPSWEPAQIVDGQLHLDDTDVEAGLEQSRTTDAVNGLCSAEDQQVGLHQNIFETEAKDLAPDTKAGRTPADIASFDDVYGVGMNTVVIQDLLALAVYKDIEDAATRELAVKEIEHPTSSDDVELRDDSVRFEYVEGAEEVDGLGGEVAGDQEAEATRLGMAGEERDDGLNPRDEGYSFKVDEGSLPQGIPASSRKFVGPAIALPDEEQADNGVDVRRDPYSLVDDDHAQLKATLEIVNVESAPKTRDEEQVDDGGGGGDRPYNLGTSAHLERLMDTTIGSPEERTHDEADEGIGVGRKAYNLRPVAQITQAPSHLESAFSQVLRDIPNVGFGRSSTVGEREELFTELSCSASALGKGRETENVAPSTPERAKNHRPVSTPPPLTASPSTSTLLDVKKRRGVSAIFGFTPSSPELMSRRDSLARVNGQIQPQSPSKRGFQLPKLKGTGRLLNGSWKPPEVASSSTPKNSPAAGLWGTAVRSVRFPGRDKTNEAGTPTPSRGNDANLTLLMPKAVSAHFYLKKRG